MTGRRGRAETSPAETSPAERLAALEQAIRAGRGVLDDDLVDRAQQIQDKAGHRLRLSPEHTVVAVAGATGSGKSSLVNALVGRDVAAVDVLRPTTSEALAVVRGPDAVDPLTDWLGVRRRHVLDEPPVPAGPADPADPADPATPAGLVLLDLPDHDSVVTGHRVEAERLLELVDLMVWVVDPQKYADAALHERYLRHLTAHRDVVLVVLNQVDRLRPDEREAAVGDLRRLLADDGLAGVPVLAVSAVTGEGVAEISAALDDVARRRGAATARVLADVSVVAERILAVCGGTPGPATLEAASPPDSDVLVDALARVSGVVRVVDAVRDGWRARGRRATGWPVTRWAVRFRPDPLRRLHLGGEGDAEGPDTAVSRTSLPRPGAAEQARARGAVRTWVDSATADLPDGWALAARTATRGGDLADDLDRAIAGTPVLPDRAPAWWRIVGALQVVLLLTAVAGGLWLAVLAGLGYLQLPVPPVPRWGEVPWPTVALAGGVVLGLLVSLLARWGVEVGARRRAGRAAARLRDAVREVARRDVVGPVEEVLDRMVQCHRAALGAMDQTRPPGRRRKEHEA